MSNDEQRAVEAAATAMYEKDPGLDSGRAWDTADEWVREEYRSLAAVAATALAAHPEHDGGRIGCNHAGGRCSNLAARPVTGTVEWAQSLENDGVFEYMTSSNYDGSNAKRWRRTPGRKPGQWSEVPE